MQVRFPPEGQKRYDRLHFSAPSGYQVKNEQLLKLLLLNMLPQILILYYHYMVYNSKTYTFEFIVVLSSLKYLIFFFSSKYTKMENGIGENGKTVEN